MALQDGSILNIEAVQSKWACMRRLVRLYLLALWFRSIQVIL